MVNVWTKIIIHGDCHVMIVCMTADLASCLASCLAKAYNVRLHSCCVAESTCCVAEN